MTADLSRVLCFLNYFLVILIVSVVILFVLLTIMYFLQFGSDLSQQCLFWTWESGPNANKRQYAFFLFNEKQKIKELLQNYYKVSELLRSPRCLKSFYIDINPAVLLYFPLTSLLTAESEANFSLVLAAEGQKYDRANRSTSNSMPPRSGG